MKRILTLKVQRYYNDWIYRHTNGIYLYIFFGWILMVDDGFGFQNCLTTVLMLYIENSVKNLINSSGKLYIE